MRPAVRHMESVFVILPEHSLMERGAADGSSDGAAVGVHLSIA